jgi:catechol 2,3-dioxygenase-like lactoylglutathione lyase family enzyme
MPQFKKLTPNLLVADVSRSLDFYADVLGFDRGIHVPDAPPFVFGSVTAGALEIFFNEVSTATKEYPALAGRPLGASGTMFIEIDGIESYFGELQGKVPIVTPLVSQWYGMKEFAIADPDGYLITFAERAEQA